MGSDLFTLLHLGAQSMAVQRAQLGIAAHNMENAGVPGYSRQIAHIEAVQPPSNTGFGYIGRGARLTGVSQARDRFIEDQLPKAASSKSKSSAEHQALSSVRALDPSETSAVGNAVAEFYASLRGMAQNPGDAVLRRNVTETARRLASTFQRTSSSIESARQGLDRKLENVVSSVNSQAERVAMLNARINEARVGGNAEPNDLMDARQRAVDELAALAGGIPIEDGNGAVNIMLPGGVALVSGVSALKLSTMADVGNRGHLSFFISSRSGGLATPFPTSGVGGTAGGIIAARDGALKDASGTLDRLAHEMATNLNAVHSTGYALDGSTGHEFFTLGATVDGSAANIAVNQDLLDNPALIAASSSATTLPGDATKLIDLVRTETQVLSTGVDATGTLSRLTSDFGNSTQRAEALAEQETTLYNHLMETRESVSGVSIDEEIVEMTKAQRGYEAIMKVIQTADQMLDTLMKLR